MYCCGDPKVKTVTGEAFCELGKDMKGYAYTDMWAGPPKYDGTYDVDDSVVGMIRTEGPVISLHGAWAQNIGVNECYIDFMGDKGGIRLQYGKDFTVYSSEYGALTEYKPVFKMRDHFQNEIHRLHQDRQEAAVSHRHRYHHGTDDAGDLRFLRAA